MSAIEKTRQSLVTPLTAESETDDPHPSPPTSRLPRRASSVGHAVPTLAHRMRHDKSILAVALTESRVYAGTQGGEILVYAFDTFEKVAVIEGHRGSVLGLCLSEDGTLLFSSAGDRITNVWDCQTLKQTYCLYSTYDIGDVFCVAYATRLQTLYLGAQNTSIQWCTLKEQDFSPKHTLHAHPLFREDRFFDSSGPGGVRTPRKAEDQIQPRHAKGGRLLEIDKANIHHFAHFGYVYCMLLARDIVSKAPGEEVLISGGGDGAINVWRLDQSNDGAISKLFTLDDGREEGHSILSMSLDGSFLYAGRAGGEVNVWDLETRQLIRSLTAHRDDIMSVCVGGGFLFSAAVTGSVRKYDRQYQVSSRFQAHEGSVLASAFKFRQGRPVYVTGGNDNTIAVWDASNCVMAPTAGKRSTDEQLLDTLKRFISYRTVSSEQSFRGDCRRGASFLRSVFKGFGAATEMLLTDNGWNPVIFARFRGNPATASKRKKILFYGHYDVVAAENDHGRWKTDPFSMEGIDGYLYGRGTSDNKGPIMAAIFACAELTAEQSLGSDILFLIEGEEESGSRGFAKAVQQHREMIGSVDWILLANSYWLDDRMPCLTYGLRGVIHATIQVESSHPDLHSGVDGSSHLDESLKDLVIVLAALTGMHGEVKIPGFYDPVPAISPDEERLYSDITEVLVARNPDLGDREELASSLMRRWREASLTIHRFQTSGPDNATIIPRLAKAALSIRLVPNQEAIDVAEKLIEYLHAEFDKLGSNNQLTVTIDHQAEPWLGDVQNEIFKTLEEAVMQVWGPVMEPLQRTTLPNRKALKITPPPNLLQVANGYLASPIKPSPTTSTTLANSSLHPSPATAYIDEALAPSPIRERPEVERKVSDRKSSMRHRRNSKPQPAKHASATPRSQPVAAQQQQNGHASNDAVDNSGTGNSRVRKPLYIREGGSIPAIRFLEKEFGAPAAHLPCGQASDSAHLDNERFRLVNLYKSKEIFKRVFRDLPTK